MKKLFLAMALATLVVFNTNAQNSDVEIAMQETKTEMFLKNCSFVRTDQVATFYSKGVAIYAQVFTDIESGEKIGALEFWAGVFLGYLDIDRVSDLITALEHTMEVSNNSSKTDYFAIDYTAPGGINFAYGNHTAGFLGTKPGLSLRKKWYSINEYGVQTVSYSTTGYIKTKHIAKLIPMIKEAQITIEKELLKKETPNVNIITKQEVTKVKSPKTAKPKEVSDDYKNTVRTQLIQVQKKYAKLELTHTPTYTAYRKAVSQLMMSTAYEDWKTLEAIHILMQKLVKEKCSIDKVALEKQLAETTTTTEIITVLKKFLFL